MIALYGLDINVHFMVCRHQFYGAIRRSVKHKMNSSFAFSADV